VQPCYLTAFISFVTISDRMQPPVPNAPVANDRERTSATPRLNTLLESNGPTAENGSEFGRHPTDAALAHRRDNDAEQVDGAYTSCRDSFHCHLRCKMSGPSHVCV
jgi:hypothetical protein